MRLNRSDTITYLFISLSILLLSFTTYSLIKIDVIEDKTWNLILPEGEIRAGDTIYVQSQYNKLRQVEGSAERYVECWTEDHILVVYLVSKAVANRAAGKGGTGLPIPIPSNIPDLPTLCHIRVVVKYHVLPFRNVIEVKSTKDFMLLPASASTESPTSTGTNQSPSQSQLQNLSSLPNPTPLAVSSQSNISQPTPQSPPEEKSFIEELLNPVKNLLERML